MTDFYSLKEVGIANENGINDLEVLIPLIYAELRKLAAFHLRNERPNHTLRPTELVHEVYLILDKQHTLNLENRISFLSFASTIMRRILINHANHRNRKKRGDGVSHVEIEKIEQLPLVEFEQHQINIIALENSLNELAKFDERQVRIVELYFFGGLTFEEIADFLRISSRTVQREWHFTRTWLYRHLQNSQSA